MSELKQWVYCRRILYYAHCLPAVRPVTYSMQAGVKAGRKEEGLEERRSLRKYGIKEGRRSFNVLLASERLGLRGELDMLIETEEGSGREFIPVDFKDSRIAGKHFRLQLAAYACMLEEKYGVPVRRGYLFLIPLRKAERVMISAVLRGGLEEEVARMKRMLETEEMPPPAVNLRKCVACEFRRFCNDVL